MGNADYLKLGSFNRICDRTGFKVKAHRTRKEWTNAIVRNKSFEHRHPQDLIRSRPDRQHVVDPRTEASDSFLADNEVTVDDL